MEPNSKARPRKAYISSRLAQIQVQMQDFPLIAFSAPMGSGKTVAAGCLLRQFPGHTARFNAEVSDPDAFWQQLCEVLVPNLPWDAPLPMLAAAICHRGATLLLIDDYQNVQCEELNRKLLRLALSEPDRLKIILCSRRKIWAEDSPEVCDGNVLLVQGSDLRLTEKEIIPFCRSCNVQVSGIQAQLLYQASEGWMMALFLMLTDYVKSGKLRVNAAIPRMLQGQVDALPAPMGEFLEYLAPIGSGFTATQAEALWQKGDAAQLLTRLLDEGFFLSYDMAEDSYHLYPLLVTALEPRLEQNPNRAEIFRRLSAWYAANGQRLDAIRHSFTAGDFPQALTLLDGLYSLSDSYPKKEDMLTWFRLCPAELLKEHLTSLLYFAWGFFLYNCMEEYHQALSLADEAIAALPAGQAQDAAVLTRTMLDSHLCCDCDKVLEDHRQIAELASKLSADRLPCFSGGFFGSFSILDLIDRNGQPIRAAEQLQKAEAVLNGVQQPEFPGLGDAAYSEAMYLTSNFNESRIYAHRAQRAAEKAGTHSLYLFIRCLELHILYARGQTGKMQELFNATRRELQQTAPDNTLIAAGMDLMETHFLISQRSPQQIAPWIRSGDFDSVSLCLPMRPFALLAHAACLMAQGKQLRVLALAPELLSTVPFGPTPLLRLYANLVLANASEQLGRHKQADQYLSDAVALAEPGNIIMPFVEFYRALHPVMERCPTEWKALHKRIPELGSRFALSGEDSGKLNPRNAAGMTLRETEIATLAAQGMYNREISARLNVSENTIKSSLRSAFTKLGIHSRRELPAALHLPGSST